MSNEWNLNTPTNDELIPDLPGEHRERKTNVATVLEKEHATLGDGNSGGEHSPGSAVAWYLATGSIPALDVEGNALASTDNGRMWLDSTTKIFYALDDYSDPTVAGGWVAMGHLLGDIAINTDKFTVARATGNTVVGGTLDVTGNIDPTSYETTNGGFLDEDAMGSDSATNVASQQSIKAYIDNNATDSQSIIKGWVNFAGADGSVNDSFNVTGAVTRNSKGNYTITWDTNFANNDYVVSVTVPETAGAITVGNVTSLSVGSCNIKTRNFSAVQDPTFVLVMAVGDQS